MRSNDYASQTDRELMIGTANRDEHAFAALYERYFEDIYDFALRLLGDPDAAPSVTQNTFSEARRSIPGRHVPDSVRAWLYSLTLADAMSPARQTPAAAPTTPAVGQHMPSLTEIDRSRLPGAEEVSQDTGLRETVWQSATQSGPRELALLDMHLRRGFSSAEVAEGSRTSPQTAESTLSDLRESFGEAFAIRILILRGRDACPELAALLQRSTAPDESPAVRQAVQAHLSTCDTCQSTVGAYPPAADIFAAFALVPPPAGLKEITWGNLASATTAAAAVPVDTHKRRPWLLILLGLLGAIAIAALLFFLLSGDDGELKDPDDVRSTSHEIGEPSPNNVVKVVWSRQDNVLAYSVDWSEEQFQLPDEVGDLSGNATDATSPQLNPGDWFFHLRTQGKDGKWTSTVHIGPFKIVAPQTATPAPTEEPEPTETPTEEPTSTPEPPTETPNRTPTASATATP
jgi:DNA-directed RNA polymerase specialized sigma24 family protein